MILLEKCPSCGTVVLLHASLWDMCDVCTKREMSLNAVLRQGLATIWPRYCVGETGIVYEIDALRVLGREGAIFNGVHPFGWSLRHIFVMDNFRGETVEKKTKDKNPDGTKKKIEVFIQPHLHPCDKDGVVIPQADRPVRWPWMTVIERNK